MWFVCGLVCGFAVLLYDLLWGLYVDYFLL